MDLVKSGVYDEDFELVWANKRDDDGYSPSDTPNPPIPPPDEPKPKSQTQYISSFASTTTVSSQLVYNISRWLIRYHRFREHQQ